ncbi:hypothetical protein LWP59_23275 [Amycolatopsis acidiphila]|uniref:Uncharacterized protein n=1 Tax=Amycolatopsis acidiphila TaxID=715473 RepID=A0A558AF82_9PSEU|nr:hypothetical protein [Amycolatopsis acidiphila]TVT22922.1 hypothetical protein FNH06_11250 [Amycolatopsis acidiphila]UIJ57078.1 hypothetical protein LWP59_23275 [Amycolatopsis acidiphila]GHG53485.1 hypothetical protein GCM10017788_02260 [Amycolatopsis acidiphila]
MTTHQLDSGLPRVLRAAGALVAPGTALVALLYYFGWLRVFWFCNYFGVNSTVLGFTTEDYLMRNVDGLFVPLAVVATITLLVAWSRYLVGPVLARRPAARLLAAGIALVVGTAAATAGFLAVFGLRLGLSVGPLCLAAGVLLLALASRLQRTGGTTRVQWALLAEWAGIFAVVCICAFWAVADYASAVGTGRAQQVEAELAGYPGVTVHSAKSLGLAGPASTARRAPSPTAPTTTATTA